MEAYTPFWTWRFDAALQLASALHHAQPRKKTKIPYIAHLMAVCALVLEAGGDEDQAIAALLHDAVEDQGGLPTLETIRHMFGDRVANAVEACSDSTVSDPTKKPPWRERKENYLAHLGSTKNKDVLLIVAADKLHNARAILCDYRGCGEQVWARFNAPKEDQLWYYGRLVETLRQTAAPEALVGELGRVVEELKEACKQKAVTPDQWKLHRMPKSYATIPVNRRFSGREIDKIKLGFSPESMDDHWFIFYEKDRLHIHRSWSGNCIYIVRFENDGHDYVACEVQANRNPKQYDASDDSYDAEMAFWVIDFILLAREDARMPERDHTS